MSDPHSSVRVLLVDDHLLVLEGIRARLEQEQGIEVAGQATDGQQALELAAKLAPDIVMMDVSMPGMGGIEATKVFRERFPEQKLLILSMHDNREYISQLMFLGARGYILKDVSASEMVRAIHTVAEGATYICKTATDSLFQEVVNPQDVKTKLTHREEIILARVAKGLSSKAISNELNISVRTVESHRQNIKSKLGLNTTAELTKYAYDQQMI